VNANRLNGVDGEVLTARAGQGDGADHQRSPKRAIRSWGLRCSAGAGRAARRGGLGFARGADAQRRDIIQDCESRHSAARRRGPGVETPKGFIRREKVGVGAAGIPACCASHGDCDCPIESHAAAGAGLRAASSRCSNRGHVQRVHGYISQATRRPRDRRRASIIRRLRPAGQLLDHRAHAAAIVEAVPDLQRGCE
jgi:hypothetical protein